MDRWIRGANFSRRYFNQRNISGPLASFNLRIWWIAWIEGSWPCWFTVHDRIAWIVGSGGPIFLGDISISETSVDQWHLFICWLRYSPYKRILVRAGSLSSLFRKSSMEQIIQGSMEQNALFGKVFPYNVFSNFFMNQPCPRHSFLTTNNQSANQQRIIGAKYPFFPDSSI